MKYVILYFICLLAIEVRAHGMDKPGPHGGQIEMPGPYHTEVVSEANGFKVYLLDIKFQNPTVKDSSVEAQITGREGKQLNCKKMTDHFFCTVEKAVKKGELIIRSMRENEKGSESKYKLPFSKRN